MHPAIQRWTLLGVAAVLSFLVFSHFSGSTALGFQFPLPFGQRRPAPLPWHQRIQHYPIAATDLLSPPSGPLPSIPSVQFHFQVESESSRNIRLNRQKAVKDAFLHSWQGYIQHAWGHDEVLPLTGGVNDPFGGWGATLVDALDTLWIMGLRKEFARAVGALKNIDFTRPGAWNINVFETNIRYLGGLLSANDLSDGNYPILKKKATQLGEMLYNVFDTPNRMPVTHWDWAAAWNNESMTASTSALSAEIGTFSLEFTRLSQLTGDPKFFDAIQRITNELERSQNTTKLPGLWPVVFNANDLVFTEETFSFGGRADSLYEYIPKEYLLLGGRSPQYRIMYENFMKTARKSLFYRPFNEESRDILISGSTSVNFMGNERLEGTGQHLVCFVGGMVAIGSKIFDIPGDLEIAHKLVDGCVWAGNVTKTGIMPETFMTAPCEYSPDCSWSQTRWYNGVNKDQASIGGELPKTSDERAEKLISFHHLPTGMTKIGDSRYILRPEVLESLFVLYRVTGNTYYQDMAWQIFENVVKYCRTPLGFAAIDNINGEPDQVKQVDSSESFWMAESLKYLYLIFSEPDLVSLDEWVFNTEAHPFRRPQQSDSV